jgi:chitinase
MPRHASVFQRTRVAFLAFSALIVLSLSVHADIWSTAYYAGWMQGTMPASNVDFTAVNYVIHFSVVPNSNGSLNSSANSLTSGNSTDVVTRAHAAGTKVLVCVGGAGSQSGFQGATSAANRPTFITNLMNLGTARRG